MDVAGADDCPYCPFSPCECGYLEEQKAAAAADVKAAAVESGSARRDVQEAVQTLTDVTDGVKLLTCEPCPPEVQNESEEWLERDAPLLSFLQQASLLQIADVLRHFHLTQLMQILQGAGRVSLLSTLKHEGVQRLTDRQKFANCLSKAMREGTLPSDGCARPDKPPPVCDKCDGAHASDACPHFRKAREAHRDAHVPTKAAPAQTSSSEGEREVLRDAILRRQPSDGNCLFHSLAHGLCEGGNSVTAAALRAQLITFIAGNPELEVRDSTSFKEWVEWETGATVDAYCQRMRQSGEWGGAIEMAACSHLLGVRVLVHEREAASFLGGGGAAGFRRIHTFDPPPAAVTAAAAAPPTGPEAELVGKTPRPKELRVLYSGGLHYDALELTDRHALRDPSPYRRPASNVSARGGGDLSGWVPGGMPLGAGGWQLSAHMR
jgi:hypothetical protein